MYVAVLMELLSGPTVSELSASILFRPHPYPLPHVIGADTHDLNTPDKMLRIYGCRKLAGDYHVPSRITTYHLTYAQCPSKPFEKMLWYFRRLVVDTRIIGRLFLGWVSHAEFFTLFNLILCVGVVLTSGDLRSPALIDAQFSIIWNKSCWYMRTLNDEVGVVYNDNSELHWNNN